MKDPRIGFVPIGECMISTLVLHATGRKARRRERENTASILNPQIASMLLTTRNSYTPKGSEQ